MFKREVTVTGKVVFRNIEYLLRNLSSVFKFHCKNVQITLPSVALTWNPTFNWGVCVVTSLNVTPTFNFLIGLGVQAEELHRP